MRVTSLTAYIKTLASEANVKYISPSLNLLLS